MSSSVKLYVAQKWPAYLIALLADVIFSVLAIKYIDNLFHYSIWIGLILYGLPNLAIRLYLYRELKQKAAANSAG